MAILWMEGFDPYGTNNLLLTNGENWASNDDDRWETVTSQARTGQYSTFRDAVAIDRNALRRILGKSVTTVGVGVGVWFTELPKYSTDHVLYSLHDSEGRTNIGLLIESTGAISVLRGHANDTGQEVIFGTVLSRTAVPAIRAKCWNYIEAKYVFDTVNGSVEVRVNGVTVLALSGVDTVAKASDHISSSDEGDCNAEASRLDFYFGSNTGSSNAQVALRDRYIDDVVVWDDSGSTNNDFLGDIRVRHLKPTADTAQADWTPLSGSGFSNIDDMPGTDDGTTYVSVGVPGSPTELSSEFELDDLATTTGRVLAVSPVSRVRKTEAGVAAYQHGIISGATEEMGAVKTLSVDYNYVEDVMQVNPDTGSEFTAAEVNSLKLKINRVT